MVLNADIKKAMENSVLCWLATASEDGVPNVSPKEVFAAYGSEQVIVANIASPQTLKNIRQNPSVCLSFIDILVQKGFQLKGRAAIVGENDAAFSAMEALLLKMTQGKFPFSTITVITVDRSKKIIAPRYLLYPETTEAEQIENAKKTYKL